MHVIDQRQHRSGLLAFAMLTAGMSSMPAAEAAELYVHGSAGYEWSRGADFRDRNCTSTQPPALFGCGTGSDGRPLGARGDFGNSPALELGLGTRVLPFLRLEAVVGHRSGLDFAGEANFLSTPGEQPVDGAVDQTTAMAFAYVDLAPLFGLDLGPVEPFVGAGAGLARNRLDPMTYRFPGLTQPAFSRTPGGTHYDAAWAATAGLGYRLSESIVVELSYRYADYGKVETSSGPLVSRRGESDFTIDIDATHARLRSHALMSGVRIGF